MGVNELCEHAGVKKGSFYHFFPSKRDLTTAALDEVARWYERDIYKPAFATDLPPIERIQRLFQLVYEYHASLTESAGRMGGCHFGNLAIELSTQDDVISLVFENRELAPIHLPKSLPQLASIVGCKEFGRCEFRGDSYSFLVDADLW